MNRKSTHIESNVDGDLLAAGSVLAKQREKLGLDKKECAESLKITQSKLTCLENGDKSAFTSELFIRGYIKNYAKLVNISEGEILHIYNAQSQVDSNLVGMVEQRPSKPKWWLPYAMGIVIVIGWFFASDYLGFKQRSEAIVKEETGIVVEPTVNDNLAEIAETITADGNEVSNTSFSVSEATPTIFDAEILTNASTEPSERELSAQLSTQATESILIEPTSSAGTSSTVTQELPVSEISELNAANVSAIDTSSSISVDEPIVVQELEELATINGTEAESLDSLYFSFTEDCWIEVIDATGKVIIKSLQVKDSHIRLAGRAPFTITFGNVDGVSLSFNNSPVVLGQGNENRTLRITLGE